METGEKAVKTTFVPSTFLKKTGTVILALLILTAFCTYITYTGYAEKYSVFLNGPVAPGPQNEIKDLLHGLKHVSSIQRSALPRSSHFISDISDNNPSSRFYSVWSEETTQIARKTTQEDRKKILVWNPWPTISMLGRRACPSMPQCEFTKDRREVADANAVIFWFATIPHVYNSSWFPQSRPADQHWIMRTPDCPHFTRNHDWKSYGGVFNRTMTYRNDSDIYMPWGHITQLYEEIARKPDTLGRHYPKQKDKIVIWYVSNCYKHLTRFAYANELMKYIQVDVFGGCGADYCGLGPGGRDCFTNHLRQYKFYLAFENFKCVEYITEKFWLNGLKRDAVPVVLGAPRRDYERFAPPNSFIHVDDFKSPRALASYLLYLSKHDDKYMQYFAWKTNPPKNLPPYKGAWCEVCKKLVQVNPKERKVYNDIDKWWRGENYEFCEPVVMLDGIRRKELAVHYP
ncbi:4-galactosyl-N-acetylglucosaminide 3-alpha-L-fucosyltransferase FUT6-like [Branchiostoma floridae]|uniref:Fucosyltransferase n=2 Tax=Branchiostoma floridae TaxID=7739 RepID=A0A9J7M9P9_BRAFL|nr:4-galactosyl-N-acetylglucosaminide 3-alpha-L-fucosyltransferase FUT6-like [Branchiostoma floridae]